MEERFDCKSRACPICLVIPAQRSDSCFLSGKLGNDGIEDKMIFLLTMAIGRCYVRFQRVLSLLQDMLSAFIAEMCANMHKLNIMKPSPDRVL